MNWVLCSLALCLKWVSQLSIDHDVWLGDWHFVGFLLGEAINLSRRILCSSRRQYRDYIIDLYGVKHCTVSNSKCAMPSLSCLFSFYTIPISLFFNSKNFLFSSLLSFFMHACIHKASGFIGGKGPRPLKKCHFAGV